MKKIYKKRKTKKWKYKHKQKTMFFRFLRPRHKKKKVPYIAKKTVTGPKKYARHIITNEIKEDLKLSKSQKKEKRLLILKNFRYNKMLHFLLSDPNSPLNIDDIYNSKYKNDGHLIMPNNFSIIDNAQESYLLLRNVVSILFLENCEGIVLDYSRCHNVELGTQVLLDIILTSFDKFATYLKKSKSIYYRLFAKNMGGNKFYDSKVAKLVFSVGSPVNLDVKEIRYTDVEKSKLIIHSEEEDKLKPSEQNETETTALVDYVINCLGKMKRELSYDQIDALCTIIGEILVNAEEHSSTRYRFSIGYFSKEKVDGTDVGRFRLVIMNLGHSIYEKFKDTNCPNQSIVRKMEALSQKYTQRKLFKPAKFEEECLWTLYALQEGVTSVLKDKEWKGTRGNGSIRFIDNFFKIKGNDEKDGKSQMHIMSGGAYINFDGTYAILQKRNSDGDSFSVMTFNDSGNIEDMPDDKYVKYSKIHFPGTMISISLYLNDVETINEI